MHIFQLIICRASNCLMNNLMKYLLLFPTDFMVASIRWLLLSVHIVILITLRNCICEVWSRPTELLLICEVWSRPTELLLVCEVCSRPTELLLICEVCSRPTKLLLICEVWSRPTELLLICEVWSRPTELLHPSPVKCRLAEHIFHAPNYPTVPHSLV